MRMTLDIDDDVLANAKTIAEVQHLGIDEVISDVVRQALTHRLPMPPKNPGDFPTLPHRGGVVTSELVAELAEDAG